MAKFRVYEIAKKYNKDNKEILEILKANHVEVKNHMSTIFLSSHIKTYFTFF